MTVLAVPGLFTALWLLPYVGDNTELGQQLLDCKRKNVELEEQLAELRRYWEESEADWAAQRTVLEREVREAAKNQKMFQAIQRAQEFIDQLAAGPELRFSPDQSLQFGDDLVSFARNGLEPIWTPDGRERLQRFCRAISRELDRTLAGGRDVRDLFYLQVEGHTDATRCPGDPHCNWWISSGRAAAFVSVMRQADFCPGGTDWTLRPIGYADTKPATGEAIASRRIALRLVPNYEAIIAGLGN